MHANNGQIDIESSAFTGVLWMFFSRLKEKGTPFDSSSLLDKNQNRMQKFHTLACNANFVFAAREVLEHIFSRFTMWWRK
jgi:hypothetical protein